MVAMPSVIQNGLHVPRGHVPMPSVHVAVIRNDIRFLPVCPFLYKSEPLEFTSTKFSKITYSFGLCCSGFLKITFFVQDDVQMDHIELIRSFYFRQYLYVPLKIVLENK